MKDYLFNEKVPFNHHDNESLTYKTVTNTFSFLFDNDQRNVVFFALALGIPTIILCIVGLFLISNGNPYLIAFDVVVVAFVIFVFYLMFKMYCNFNKTAEMYNKTKD